MMVRSILVLVLSYVCGATALVQSDGAYVRELHPESLDDLKGVVVNYGSPYCMHCKRLQPIYEAGAAYLAAHRPEIVFGAVNCVDFGDFCAAQGIKAYPLLRQYSNDGAVLNEAIGDPNAGKLISLLTDGKVPGKNTYTPPKHQDGGILSPPEIPAVKTPDQSIYLSRDGLNALVRLAIPGAPFVNGYPSVVLLNFTFSSDGHHLILNDQVFALTVPNPSVPARLEALQLPTSVLPAPFALEPKYRNNIFASGLSEKLLLDYDFHFRNRDDPNIRYYNYHPELHLNIIGCLALGGQDAPHVLLDAPTQQTVVISMRDQSGTDSRNPRRNFTIASVDLVTRGADYRAPEPNEKSCSPFSWRCADIADPPWYETVWQAHFDELGRIGSLRWRALRFGSCVHHFIAMVPGFAWVLLAIAILWRIINLRRAGEEPLPDDEKAIP